MHIVFRLECVKTRGHLTDLGIGGKITLKLKFKKIVYEGKTVFTYRYRWRTA